MEPYLVPTRHAFVVSNDLLGYHVVRPGIPDINARRSWHLTRGQANRVAAAWNEALKEGRT